RETDQSKRADYTLSIQWVPGTRGIAFASKTYMCATAVFSESRVRAPGVHLDGVGHVIASGVFVGLVGTLTAATVHSLAIAAIWSRIPGGLLQAIPVGVALSWAFEQVANARGWRTTLDGARFGGILFLALVPATAFSNLLRLNGMHAGDWPGTLGSLA